MTNVTMCTWVTETIEEQIKQLIEQGKYTNRADFIRTAVREKLDREDQ